MTFLPIVERELRVAARRASTYWMRAGAALAGICLTAWALRALSMQPPAQLGSELFATIAGFCFAYCVLYGMRATHDCIGSEKRDGTLGLLFLTDLKGYDVVLGKLVATSLNTVYGLLAVFPVLAIPILLGAVSPEAFVRMTLALANTLLFSLTLGLLVSAITDRPRVAILSAVVLMFLITAGPLIATAWAASRPGTAVAAAALVKVTGVIVLPSPYIAFQFAFDQPAGAGPNPFWVSLATVHCLSWIFLGIAGAIVRNCWQDRPATTQRLRWRERWRNWGHGDSVERQEFRGHLLDINPVYWLAARDRLKPAYVWGFLGLALVGWVWGALKGRGDWFCQAVYIATALVLNSTLKVWVASEASWRFAHDRNDGALELLLSTPMKVQEILYGEFLALKHQFFMPCVVNLLVDAMFILATLRDDEAAADRAFMLMFWIALSALFVADLFTLFAVGLWSGLTARNPSRAARGTIFRILTLPWLLFSLLGVAGSLNLLRFQFIQDDRMVLGLAFGLFIVIDLWFGLWAWYRLNHEFRVVAAHRFAPKPPRRAGWGRGRAKETIKLAPPVATQS